MNIDTHAARRSLRASLAALAFAIAGAGCDDDPVDPSGIPDLIVEASASEFVETDVAIGTDETIAILVRNDGDGILRISSLVIEGSDAQAFAIVEGGDIDAVAPGSSREVIVGFAPTSEGDKEAVVRIETNDPDRQHVEVSVRGRAARFQYRQVDRKGIPGLNTVFNHPSGIGPFDKTAYNLASPSDDVADYTGLFETVLGAVGNADPAATAALLLPDELPVSLGAATAFANLTGRTLSDDAVDVALLVTVGVPALQSDHVDGNDKPFRTTFPYVATSHD